MDQPDLHRAILLLGAGRSGTSAVARGLAALGVDLGDHLVKPDPTENPRGYFEDDDLRQINDDLLAAVGSSNMSLRLLSPAIFAQPSLETLRDRAQSLIQRRYGRSPLWGFKDPRTVLTLPFWQGLLREGNYQDAYVLAVRNPLSVAASLANIDVGFDVRRSCIFWLLRNAAALTQAWHRPCVVVNYDTLLTDPRGQLWRMAQALSLPWTLPVAQAVDDYVATFLNLELRHTSYNLEDLTHHPAVPPVVYRAYESLAALADDRLTPTDAHVREQWTHVLRELDDFAPLLTYCQDLETYLGKHVSQVPTVPGTLHRFHNRLTRGIRHWLKQGTRQ
jgi:hypothetical protein